MAEPITEPFSPKFQSKAPWTGKPGKNVVFPLSTGTENLRLHSTRFPPHPRQIL